MLEADEKLTQTKEGAAEEQVDETKVQYIKFVTSDYAMQNVII